MSDRLLRSEGRTLTEAQRQFFLLPGLPNPTRRSRSSGPKRVKKEPEFETEPIHNNWKSESEIKDFFFDCQDNMANGNQNQNQNQEQNPDQIQNQNERHRFYRPRLPDVLSMIPTFSGDSADSTLYEFISACKDAIKILPAEALPSLTQVVKTKLKGGALQLVRCQNAETMDDLFRVLHDIYFSPQSSMELSGELSQLKQNKNESVASYFSRACALQNQLLEKLKEELNIDEDLPAEREQEVERACGKYFTLGLRKDIFQLMREHDTLNEAGPQAIEIEHNLKSRADVTSRNETILCLLCGKGDHKIENCSLLTNKTQKENCQLCHGEDHTASECRNHYFCQLCNQKGHTATNCRSRGQPSTWNRNICQLCKKFGHIARNCRFASVRLTQPAQMMEPSRPDRRFQSRRSNNVRIVATAPRCTKCNARGHNESQCRRSANCYRCNQPGHFSRECRNPQVDYNQVRTNNNTRTYTNGNRLANRSNTSRYCTFCNRNGHLIADCLVRLTCEAIQRMNTGNGNPVSQSNGETNVQNTGM